MSDGIKISEIPEIPQESREVTEARQQIEQATLEPEAALEKGDITQAEQVEEAFKTAMDAAVPAAEGASAEMAGAQPGEVGGFGPEEDGGQAYELIPDGETGAQPVEENLDQVETAQETLRDTAVAENLPDLSLQGEEFTGSTSSDQQEVLAGIVGGSGQDQSGLEQIAEPSLDEARANEETTDTDSTKVVTGSGAAAAASGLPLDEDLESGSQGNTAAPDIETVAQESLRETYLESSDDLIFHADEVRFFNTQKDAVRDYLADLQSDAQAGEATPGTISEGLQTAGEVTGSLTVAEVPELTPSADSEDSTPEDTSAVIRKMSGGEDDSDQGDDSHGQFAEVEESLEDEAQLANVDLQNMLQKQQQMIQMLSGISKILHDTANAVIRNADDGSYQDELESESDGSTDQEGGIAAAELVVEESKAKVDPQVASVAATMETLTPAESEAERNPPPSAVGGEIPTDRTEDPDTTRESSDPLTGIRGEMSDQVGDSGGEGVKYPPEPQLEDFQTGVDQNGDPIYDQDAYNQAMADWQAKTWNLAADARDTPPFIPEQEFFETALEKALYLEQVIDKSMAAVEKISSEIQNWPEDGEHSFTVMVPVPRGDFPQDMTFYDYYFTVSSPEEAWDLLQSIQQRMAYLIPEFDELVKEL